MTEKSIFSLEEHASCFSYCTAYDQGFVLHYLERTATHDEVIKKDTILFLLKGSLDVRYRGFSLLLQEGFMCFFSRQDEVKVKACADSTVIVAQFEKLISPCTKFHLSSLNNCRNDVKYSFSPLAIKPVLLSFVQVIEKYLKSGVNCIHLHEIKLKELFMLLRFYYTDVELANFLYFMLGSKKEESLRIIVMDNWKRTRNVKELAELCHLSVSTFRRHFKQEFGQTIGDWLDQNMKDLIIHKLSDPEASIDSIACELNFSSAAHFCTYCQKQFGLSPSDIRKIYSI